MLKKGSRLTRECWACEVERLGEAGSQQGRLRTTDLKVSTGCPERPGRSARGWGEGVCGGHLLKGKSGRGQELPAGVRDAGAHDGLDQAVSVMGGKEGEERLEAAGKMISSRAWL